MSHETQAFRPYTCNTSSRLLFEIPRYLWGLIKSRKWDENSRTRRSRAGRTHRVCNAEKRKKGSGMQFAAVGRDARAERRQSDGSGVFSHKGGRINKRRRKRNAVNVIWRGGLTDAETVRWSRGERNVTRERERKERKGDREKRGKWKTERGRYGKAYVHFRGTGPKQSPARIILRAPRDVIHLVVNTTRSVPVKGSWSLLSPPEQSARLIRDGRGLRRGKVTTSQINGVRISKPNYVPCLPADLRRFLSRMTA